MIVEGEILKCKVIKIIHNKRNNQRVINIPSYIKNDSGYNFKDDEELTMYLIKDKIGRSCLLIK